MFAAGINELDGKIRGGHLRLQDGRTWPKRVGCEFAGEVVAVGPEAGGLRVGERVFGWRPFDELGALAELVACPGGLLHRLPAAASWAQGAALPMVGATALRTMRDEASDLAGCRVLVNGAAGGAGHLAVQVARLAGARVTAVAGPDDRDFVRELGADLALDYRAVDVTGRPERYDVVVDFAKALPWVSARGLLVPGGRYLDVQPSARDFVGSAIANAFRAQTRDVVGVEVTARDLAHLAQLVEAGKLRVVVGARYPWTDFAGAYRRLEGGEHVRGKAVFAVASAT